MGVKKNGLERNPWIYWRLKLYVIILTEHVVVDSQYIIAGQK